MLTSIEPSMFHGNTLFPNDGIQLINGPQTRTLALRQSSIHEVLTLKSPEPKDHCLSGYSPSRSSCTIVPRNFLRIFSFVKNDLFVLFLLFNLPRVCLCHMHLVYRQFWAVNQMDQWGMEANFSLICDESNFGTCLWLG